MSSGAGPADAGAAEIELGRSLLARGSEAAEVDAAIPVIDMIYDSKLHQRRKTGVQCLVLVPTHELAIQLHGVFESIAKYTTVKILALIGGVDQDPQIEQLEKKTES